MNILVVNAAGVSGAAGKLANTLKAIGLTTLPPGQSVSGQTIAGYNVRSWSDAQFTYVAVSDLASADLATFERAFSAASPVPETK